MGIQLREKVELEINGVSFIFNLDHAAYDAMLGEISEKNRITPVKDYLLTIIDQAQRNDLLSIINLPAVALQIAEKVNEILIPKLEIKVKK